MKQKLAHIFSVIGRVDFSGRHVLLQVILVVLFLTIAGRAIYLHVFDRDFLRKQGDARIVRTETINAHRGMIMDRNGVPLAVSTPVTSLWVNPKEVFELAHPDLSVKKPKSPVILDVEALAIAIGLEPEDLKQRINRNNKKEFLYLKRHLPPDIAQVVLDRDFPAVYGVTEYRRYYPEGEATAHVIGFTDLDDKGKEGVELAFEESLKGVSGLQQVIRDRKGRKIKDIAELRPAKAGQDISLSFDARVQYIANRELAAAVAASEAKAGYLIALDVETGEVLAMVNQPTYNPNNRSQLNPQQLRNRAVIDMFEPGSTMKVLTVAAGLESGKFTPESKFNTNPGTMQVLNHLVRDHENYGVIDLGTIITKSSNVGATQIALALPPEGLPTFFQRFGFGRTTGSGFPGESRGLIQPRSEWRPVQLSTMSYGNGIAVTVLQLIRSYATIANGGVQLPISFTKVTHPPQGTRLISEHIAEQLVPMMESVVSTDGTAIKAAVPGYRVAGKTGTAHKAKAGGYAKDEYMSLFAGLAPASDPRVAMVVVMDGAKKGGYYGGTVSAPVFSRVMAETLRLMNIPLDKSLDAPAKAKAKTTTVTPPLVTQPKGHA